MLDKELNKLRDKTLSFWCRIIDKTHSFFWKSVPEEMIIVSKSMEFYETDWVYLLHYRWNPTVNFPIEDILDGEKCEIIWNQLTRWRIEYLKKLKLIYYTSSFVWVEYNSIERQKASHLCHEFLWVCSQILIKFDENIERYNQSELERMKHEKRPELKKLLLKFSNYL